MAREPFYGWYKERFNELSEPPPDDVWNSVSSQLDIDEVWREVDFKLTVIERRKKTLRRISYTLLLLLLFGGTGTVLVYSLKKPNEEIAGAEKLPVVNSFKNHVSEGNSNLSSRSSGALNPQDPGQLTSSLSKGNEILSSFHTHSKYYPPYTGNSRDTIVMQTEDKVVGYGTSGLHKKTSGNFVTGEDGLMTIHPLPLSFLPLHAPDSLSMPVIPLPGNMNDDFIKDGKNAFRGFYFGGVYIFKNTWLLNNKTFKGLSPRSLDQTNLHFGNSFGISGGYYITPEWNVELNWYYFSRQGQTYHVYDEGEYLLQKINLDFMLFNISVKRNSVTLPLKSNFQMSGSFISGLNYAVLKRGDDGTASNSSYSKSDYGFRIGYEFNFLLSNRFLFSPGITCDIGLKNIYEGNSSLPKNFNRTYNAALGLNMGLKYLLRGE